MNGWRFIVVPVHDADGIDSIIALAAREANGSLIVIDAASLEAAREIAAGDPYAAAGLFAAVEIRPWLWTINAPTDEDE